MVPCEKEEEKKEDEQREEEEEEEYYYYCVECANLAPPLFLFLSFLFLFFSPERT